MMLLAASLVYCAVVMRQQGVYQHVGSAYTAPPPMKTVYVDRVQDATEMSPWAVPLSRDRLRADRRAERDRERQWERDDERRRRERRRERRDRRRREEEQRRHRRRREHRHRHRYDHKDHQSDVESSHGPSTLSTSSGGSFSSASSAGSDDGGGGGGRPRTRARTRAHPRGHVPGRRRREYVGERAVLEQQTVLANERQQEELLAELNDAEWDVVPHGAPPWMLE